MATMVVVVLVWNLRRLCILEAMVLNAYNPGFPNMTSFEEGISPIMNFKLSIFYFLPKSSLSISGISRMPNGNDDRVGKLSR